MVCVKRRRAAARRRGAHFSCGRSFLRPEPWVRRPKHSARRRSRISSLVLPSTMLSLTLTWSAAPSATMAPAVGLFCAAVGSSTPPCVRLSSLSTLTNTRSPTGLTPLNCRALRARAWREKAVLETRTEQSRFIAAAALTFPLPTTHKGRAAIAHLRRQHRAGAHDMRAAAGGRREHRAPAAHTGARKRLHGVLLFSAVCSAKL